MTETKNWTILKGKVVKIHRKWVTNRICPRIPFLTKRNKYQYLRLCVQNYELMKDSRKRIIRQRDKLLKENERLKKEIVKLEKFSKLAEENSSLYTTLRGKNAEIQKLERLLEQRRREDFEYRRRFNLIQAVVDGRM